MEGNDVDWCQVGDGMVDLLDNINVVPCEDAGVPLVAEGVDFVDGIYEGGNVSTVLHCNGLQRYLPVRKQMEKKTVNAQHANGFAPKRWVILVANDWSATSPEDTSVRCDYHSVAAVIFEMAVGDCPTVAAHEEVDCCCWVRHYCRKGWLFEVGFLERYK